MEPLTIEALKDSLTRIEGLLERLKADYYRDVIERIHFLESEIVYLRREVRRINELLESSVRRTHGEPRPLIEGPSHTMPPSLPSIGRTRPRAHPLKKQGLTTLSMDEVTNYLSNASDTELKILKLLVEKPEFSSKGSTEIAKAIGKVREHTARTLKKLCEIGILLRDEGTFPYSYKVPQEVVDAVKKTLGSGSYSLR
ncbi:MAG: hypothetical protein QXK12_02395 [Candidatus Nezhaarchaeales archaeon]